MNQTWLTSSGGPDGVGVSCGLIYQAPASNRSSSLRTWVKEAELGQPGPLLLSIEEWVRQAFPLSAKEWHDLGRQGAINGRVLPGGDDRRQSGRLGDGQGTRRKKVASRKGGGECAHEV